MQAIDNLQQAASESQVATAAYDAARRQHGATIAAARDELNAADMAFNQAKTIAYKSLNSAQQAYKDALAT